MVPLRRGKIINFCSLLTFQGGLTVPAYAAAKGALGQLTKALSNEWSAHNVQVNGICPGYIDTDMYVYLFGCYHLGVCITFTLLYEFVMFVIAEHCGLLPAGLAFISHFFSLLELLSVGCLASTFGFRSDRFLMRPVGTKGC